MISVNQEVSDEILRTASAEADMAGIASVESFNGCPEGSHPTDIFPGCRSIVVFAFKHLDTLARSSNKNCQALSQDLTKHMVMHGAYRIARALEERGFLGFPVIGSIKIWPFEGTEDSDGRISLRHAAEAAGIGVISRIGIVLTPDFGPRIQLGAVLTDCDLIPTLPLEEDPCIGCDICIRKCPAGAIENPPVGVRYLSVDQDKCLNYRRREGGTSPLGYTNQCALCRSVCPVGRIRHS